MSDLRGFRYALQPVLLTRRWHVAQLQHELSALRADVRAAAEAGERMQERVANGQRAWEVLARTERDIQAYFDCSNYFLRMEAELAEAAKALAALAARRDALIDAVHAAQRELDAVETHRAGIQQQFVRDRLSKEYRATDDLWSMQAASKELQ